MKKEYKIWKELKDSWVNSKDDFYSTEGHRYICHQLADIFKVGWSKHCIASVLHKKMHNKIMSAVRSAVKKDPTRGVFSFKNKEARIEFLKHMVRESR